MRNILNIPVEEVDLGILKRLRIILISFFLFLIVLILVTHSTAFWKIFYPLPHQEYIFKYAREYDIDPYLIAAVIRVESKFYTEAESGSGARGLMQIMPDTAVWAAEKMELKDFHVDLLYEPNYNIKIGSWYLSDLEREFDGDLVLILAAYNGGRGNVKKWIESKQWSGEHAGINQIPFPETREYVKRVLRDYTIYRKLYRADP